MDQCPHSPVTVVEIEYQYGGTYLSLKGLTLTATVTDVSSPSSILSTTSMEYPVKSLVLVPGGEKAEVCSDTLEEELGDLEYIPAAFFEMLPDDFDLRPLLGILGSCRFIRSLFPSSMIALKLQIH